MSQNCMVDNSTFFCSVEGPEVVGVLCEINLESCYIETELL